MACGALIKARHDALPGRAVLPRVQYTDGVRGLRCLFPLLEAEFILTSETGLGRLARLQTYYPAWTFLLDGIAEVD